MRGVGATYSCVILLFIFSLFSYREAAAAIDSVWVVDDGEKIKKYDMSNPLRMGQNNYIWDGDKIRLFCARNEIVAFQVVITTDASGAADVSVALPEMVSVSMRIANDFSLAGADRSDLSNSVGRRIELFREHYLNVTTPSRTLYISDMNNLNGPGWYPDPLIPFELGKARGGAPFDIGPSCNQAVWVDIYVPRDQTAGIYTGTLTVNKGGTTVQEIPVTLEVLDFTLPEGNHLTAWAYLADPWMIAKRHGFSSPGSAEYYGVERQYIKMAHRHRLTMCAERDLYWVTEESDNERMYLDGQLFSATHGYEGPGENTGNDLWNLYIEDTGNATEFGQAVEGWYNWFASRGLDWGKAVFYVWDEPDEEDYPWIRQIADWDHSFSHPVRMFVTEYINQGLLRGGEPEWIDFWCPPAAEGSGGYDIANAAGRRAAGCHVGVYNGHRPGAATVLIDDDGIAMRSWSWAAFKHDVDLWYYWDVCYWKDYQGTGAHTDLWNNPLTFNDGADDWENVGNGDGTLFYPGEDKVYPSEDRGISGPISSFRMKNWRRGLQDYEYMYMANAAGRGYEAFAIVNQRVPAVFSDATGLSIKSWSSHGFDWETSRRALADLIPPGFSLDDQSVRPRIILSLNARAYRPGDELRLDYTLVPGTHASLNFGDIYLAVIAPGGELYFYNGSFTRSVEPIAASITLPPLSGSLGPARLEILPVGSYRIVAVVCAQGRSPLLFSNWHSPLAEALFSMSP